LIEADGSVLTVTVSGDEVEVQPFPSVAVTVKVPLVLTVIEGVVSELLHT